VSHAMRHSMNQSMIPDSGIHRSLTRRITIFVLCCAPLVLFVSGCKKPEESTPTPVVSVKAEKPEQGEIAESIVADATLTPLAQSAISPKIAAPVERFYVQRGARVKAGQLLATLESKDLAAAALDNKGAYDTAQAAYATQTKAQVPEDTQKAQLDVRQAKAQLDLSQSIVNARKQLFAEGAIPGRDLDTAEAALVQAQAAYDTAVMHLKSLESVSREAALAQAQGQLTSAKGKYLGAAAQVSYSEIRSPINGVVTDRPLFAGETAAAGTPLITVMDTSALIAKVHLAQIVVQRLKLNDAATITVPGITDPVPAKISLISPAVDPGSTTVEVWLRIENRKGALKAGTPVHANISGRSVASALKVPVSSILTADDGTKSVMVIGTDGAAHKKSVTLGISNGEDIQVLTGIAANDQVITNAYGIDEGTKVRIGADDDDKAADDNSGDAKPAAGKSEDDK
jgi:HlyD family secretion protein